MDRKIRVGILFGGKSAEHEISLQSARSIIEAIDTDTYEVTLISVDKMGRWHLGEAPAFTLDSGNPGMIELNATGSSVTLIPGATTGQLASLSGNGITEPVDVIFPVLHGTFGEDGTIQGMLKLANIPFVGACVLGSAIGMDKDVTKRLLRDAGIPIAKFLAFNRSERDKIDFDDVKSRLGIPFFVKPANLGSSVGVNKVKNEEQFKYAVKDAFTYDNKILIEEYIEGREIECAILGNGNPITSVPGEVIPKHEFYAYETKYVDDDGAALEIPARLSEQIAREIRSLAVKTFKALCCEGMARVDFFLRNGKEIFVNEINTIPGFTKISMYPKLWEASGISYTELIDRLIQLSLERFNREAELKTSFKL